MVDSKVVLLTATTSFLASVSAAKLSPLDIQILSESRSPLLQELVRADASKRPEIWRRIANAYFGGSTGESKVSSPQKEDALPVRKPR